MKKYKKRMKDKVVKKPNKLEEKIKINSNLLRAKIIFRRLIMILVGGIIFLFIATIIKVFASENEQVKEGREILSEIQNSQRQYSDIKAKDFQKPIDLDVANWTRNLENKLNEDVKNAKPIIEPELTITKENQELANELIEKSQGVINESLGISHDKVHGNKSYTDFLIFASFSLGEKNLENLIKLASNYNGAVILRGFKNGSFKETAAFLSKFSQDKEGVLIDPNLFIEYEIIKMPTFVLTKPCNEGLQASCKTVFDKLTGMVSPRYALEKFSSSGELAREAKERLGR
jgi:type-F conjugative transfer system pilin assembly protein TrbC